MADMLQSRANTKSVAGCWRFSEISTLCRTTATVALVKASERVHQGKSPQSPSAIRRYN